MRKAAAYNSPQYSAETALGYWNKCGFALCTDGYADIVINEQDFRLTHGCAFVVTPLVQIGEFRPSANYREISFIDDLRFYYPVFKLIADTPVPLNVRRHPCWRLSDAVVEDVIFQSNRISELQRRILLGASSVEHRLLEQQASLIRHQTMLNVVCDHTRLYPVETQTVSRQEAVAYNFLLSLHDNFCNERSVGRYAAEARLSVGHFSTVIRNATGKSPSQWIANMTTAYAKLLLEQGDKSIKEIALELNFPEQFTFRKYFRQHTGMSPTEYRRHGLRLRH